VTATAAAPAPPSDSSTRKRLKSMFGGSIGNLIEWYDWYAYSAFALYFAKAFFPSSSPTVQLLNTAGIFALGFVVRPIGGWALGRYADRRGRKAALTLSVLLMSFGSLLIAIAPTYASIGIAAPALLLFARLLQGFSVGGEYGTSATYMSEIATRDRRGFYSGVLYVTLILGQLLALGVLLVLQYALLTEQQLEAWGWRIPFAIGAVAALGALYLRRALPETDAFAASRASSHAGQLRFLLEHRREVLIVIGLTMGGTLHFYVFTTYAQVFLAHTTGLSKNAATLVSAACLFIFMLLQPAMGALSDRVGRRPMLIAFGVLALLTTVPILSALQEARDVWTAFALVMIALGISSLYSSISAVVKAELFPVEIRALGVGLPYAIAVSLFGGSAPSVALWFKLIGHETWFYWYVTACVSGSLLVYVFMREPQTSSRI
jgi:MHS family alpha-ketoglutarate permease-like MFS transporter